MGSSTSRMSSSKLTSESFSSSGYDSVTASSSGSATSSQSSASVSSKPTLSSSSSTRSEPAPSSSLSASSLASSSAPGSDSSPSSSLSSSSEAAATVTPNPTPAKPQPVPASNPASSLESEPASSQSAPSTNPMPNDPATIGPLPVSSENPESTPSKNPPSPSSAPEAGSASSSNEAETVGPSPVSSNPKPTPPNDQPASVPAPNPQPAQTLSPAPAPSVSPQPPESSPSVPETTPDSPRPAPDPQSSPTNNPQETSPSSPGTTAPPPEPTLPDDSQPPSSPSVSIPQGNASSGPTLAPSGAESSPPNSIPTPVVSAKPSVGPAPTDVSEAAPSGGVNPENSNDDGLPTGTPRTVTAADLQVNSPARRPSTTTTNIGAAKRPTITTTDTLAAFSGSPVVGVGVAMSGSFIAPLAVGTGDLITVLSTSTASDGTRITATNVIPNPSTQPNGEVHKTSSFFDNTGAVVGTFIAAGLVGIALLSLLVICHRRRRRRRGQFRWLQGIQQPHSPISSMTATTEDPFEDPHPPQMTQRANHSSSVMTPAHPGRGVALYDGEPHTVQRDRFHPLFMPASGPGGTFGGATYLRSISPDIFYETSRATTDESRQSALIFAAGVAGAPHSTFSDSEEGPFSDIYASDRSTPDSVYSNRTLSESPFGDESDNVRSDDSHHSSINVAPLVPLVLSPPTRPPRSLLRESNSKIPPYRPLTPPSTVEQDSSPPSPISAVGPRRVSFNFEQVQPQPQPQLTTKATTQAVLTRKTLLDIRPRPSRDSVEVDFNRQ